MTNFADSELLLPPQSSKSALSGVNRTFVPGRRERTPAAEASPAQARRRRPFWRDPNIGIVSNAPPNQAKSNQIKPLIFSRTLIKILFHQAHPVQAALSPVLNFHKSVVRRIIHGP
jgi:hypothetical protein